MNLSPSVTMAILKTAPLSFIPLKRGLGAKMSKPPVIITFPDQFNFAEVVIKLLNLIEPTITANFCSLLECDEKNYAWDSKDYAEGKSAVLN